MSDSFSFACCCEAIEILHHLVVVLLNFEFTLANIMKLKTILETLNKINVANGTWSTGVILILSLSPHRFHKKNLHIHKDI